MLYMGLHNGSTRYGPVWKDTLTKTQRFGSRVLPPEPEISTLSSAMTRLTPAKTQSPLCNP